MNIVKFVVFVAVAYKVIAFILSILDVANNCGVFEACGM